MKKRMIIQETIMKIRYKNILHSALLGGALFSAAPMALALLNPGTPAPPAVEQTQETRRGFFDLYAENRAQNRPNYITADFWLLSYSMIRDATLVELEQKKIMPLFFSLLTDLSNSIARDTKDPAQLANQEYLAILTALLTGEHTLASERAKKELALILDAKGINQSPLWEKQMDYSQFKPRGRYTETAEQRQYFQAMRYAGSVLFSIQASAATGVSQAMAERMTQQAMLLTQAMQGNKAAASLDKLLSWQMGAADDLTSDDLIKVGKKKTIQQQQQALLSYAKKEQKQPKIISGIVDVTKLEKGTSATDVLTGWRLMPLRYSADNAVFQSLLYPNTGKYLAECKKCALPFGAGMVNGQLVKNYPSAKELMALLNSSSAQSWVEAQHEDNFERYASSSKQAQAIIADAKGLNASHLDLLQTWLKNTDLTEQQADEHLSSSLGFWTWQRYIGLLYSKQSYSLMGKSFSIPQARQGAQLEKATALYQGLAKIVKQHQQFTPHKSWEEFAETLATAIKISIKKADKLSAEEDAFLNDLDKTLLNYTHGMVDKPIIVDVHTNPGEGMVVEEGVGLAKVVKEKDAWGARFSHYEFKQPLSERLDNAGWLQKLQSKK